MHFNRDKLHLKKEKRRVCLDSTFLLFIVLELIINYQVHHLRPCRISSYREKHTEITIAVKLSVGNIASQVEKKNINVIKNRMTYRRFATAKIHWPTGIFTFLLIRLTCTAKEKAATKRYRNEIIIGNV